MLNGLLTGSSAVNAIDWSTIITADSFNGLTNGISTVLPVVIPVAIGIAAIPVVWKFVKRFMRG